MYFVPFLPLALVLNNFNFDLFSLFLKFIDSLHVCAYSLYHLGNIWPTQYWRLNPGPRAYLYKHSITELHIPMSPIFLAFLLLLFFKDFSYVHSRPFEVP